MTIDDKLTTWRAARAAVKTTQDQLRSVMAAADSAGKQLVTQANPGDGFIPVGSGHREESEPVILANVGGDLQILGDMDRP